MKPSVYKYHKILMIQVSNNKTKSMKGLTHGASPCERISFLGLRFCISPFNRWILHLTLKSHKVQWDKPSTFLVLPSFMSKMQFIERHFSINSELFCFSMSNPNDDLTSVEFRSCKPWCSPHRAGDDKFAVRAIGTRLKEQEKT